MYFTNLYSSQLTHLLAITLVAIVTEYCCYLLMGIDSTVGYITIKMQTYKSSFFPGSKYQGCDLPDKLKIGIKEALFHENAKKKEEHTSDPLTAQKLISTNDG